MKAVHFGAGNIGRGFIGLLLSRSGYRVTFVDVNDAVVEALNRRRSYMVDYAGSGEEAHEVAGVDAIHGSDAQAVAAAVAGADLVTTAVGVGAFGSIAPALAEGIRQRLRSGAPPLRIMACENAIGGSSRLEQAVAARLTEEERRLAGSSVFYPNCAVDRIVPQQHHDDPLRVTVEPFCEWVVEELPDSPPSPRIQGVHYVAELEPYISRKLFTVNTGHACAAYYGYLQGCGTIREALANGTIAAAVGGALRETGALLVRRYGFDESEHERYIAVTLERFANPQLADDVVRVGRSPLRKLSPDERFVRPAVLAYEAGLATENLTNAIAAAMRFDYPEDAEAAELQAALREYGPGVVVSRYMGLGPEHPLHAAITERYASLRKEGRHERS